MGQVVTVSLEQMITLFFFMGFGFFLRKKHLVHESFGTALSKVEIWFFLPLMTFRLLVNRFTVANLRENGILMLVSAVTMFACYGLSHIWARLLTKQPNTRDVYVYGLSFPNTGYLGLPLVSAVFGSEILAMYTVYTIPFSIGIYTIGEYTMRTDKTLNLKTIVNPSVVSIVAGVILGLCNVKLPSVVDDICVNADACVGPIAMLISGFVFGGCDLKSLFKKIPPYLGVAIRLLILPFAAMGLCWLFRIPPIPSVLTVLLTALPAGMNVVIFPAMHGGDAESGAQFCFLAHLFSIATLPLVIAVSMMLWPI